MADGQGQPKPAFYVAVFLVVIGLVAVGLWRMGKIGPGRRERLDHQRRAGAAPDQGRGPGQLRHHHGQGVQVRRRAAAARGEGHLELQAAGRPHRPARHQRLGRLEPDHLRQQRLQAGQGVEDAGRQGLQARARAHRRPDRDARRVRRRQHPRRLGDARHAAALPRGPAQGLARHAARLPADRLVQRRRRHRRPREHQDHGRSARQDDRAGPELAVALLRAERAHQRGRAAGGSQLQVHAGCLPGGGRVQRRQEPRRRRQLGARHLQPGKGERQPDPGHDVHRQQADRGRLVRARRLRQGQPGHHGRPRPRHVRRDGGAEGSGGQAEGRQADGRRLLDSRDRRARHARRRALHQLRREPRLLPQPEQPDQLRAHLDDGLLPLQEDQRRHRTDAVRSGDGLHHRPEARRGAEVLVAEERVRHQVRAGDRRVDPGREGRDPHQDGRHPFLPELLGLEQESDAKRRQRQGSRGALRSERRLHRRRGGQARRPVRRRAHRHRGPHRRLDEGPGAQEPRPGAVDEPLERGQGSHRAEVRHAAAEPVLDGGHRLGSPGGPVRP